MILKRYLRRILRIDVNGETSLDCHIYLVRPLFFVDDFHPLIYTVRFRPSQEIIQVWHAVGAFKTVGFSRTGKKGGPFIDSLNHRSYTKAYVSSETDIPFYAEAFGIRGCMNRCTTY